MRVFLIGVCGTAMGNAAVLFKKDGSRSGRIRCGVYPPMSDVLESAGIELFEGFAEQDMLTWQPDRVVWAMLFPVEIHRSNIFCVPERLILYPSLN